MGNAPATAAVGRSASAAAAVGRSASCARPQPPPSPLLKVKHASPVGVCTHAHCRRRRHRPSPPAVTAAATVMLWRWPLPPTPPPPPPVPRKTSRATPGGDRSKSGGGGGGGDGGGGDSPSAALYPRVPAKEKVSSLHGRSRHRLQQEAGASCRDRTAALAPLSHSTPHRPLAHYPFRLLVHRHPSQGSCAAARERTSQQGQGSNLWMAATVRAVPAAARPQSIGERGKARSRSRRHHLRHRRRREKLSTKESVETPTGGK